VSPSTTRMGLRAAPWILWFGVLGGATAWSLHTLVQWGLDETVCRSGHDEISGIPLRPLLLAVSLALLVLCAVSATVAYRHWRTLRGAHEDEDGLVALRVERAGFMSLVGFVGNIVFGLMLICAVITVLVFPVCGA